MGTGPANVITGFFGGMDGCAMIGQTMINVKASGARTRISTFLAGLFLLILVVGFGDVVAVIPMAALVAVMIMVAVGTFDWHSVQPATLRRMPKSETAVMLSSNDLYTQFEYAADPDRVVIDLSESHIWDASTVAALDAITTKYERKHKTVEIVGLNDASAARHGRLSGELPSH